MAKFTLIVRLLGFERETVNAAFVVPESPSLAETSQIERFGTVTTVHGFNGEPVLRGAGVPAEKSEALLSVSTQPLLARDAEVVLLKVGAAAPSKKLAFPYPTKSIIIANCAAEQGVDPPFQPRDAVELTRATLPAVPLILIGVASITSGVGSGEPTAAVDASWIRRY